MNSGIFEIDEELQSVDLGEYDILSGATGIALYYAYMYKIFPTQSNFKLLSFYLDKTFELVANAPATNFSFGYGLAGLGWALQELSDLGLINLEEFSILDLNELDELIEGSLKEDVYYKNYDFFSGIIGKGVYFLKRYKSTNDPAFLYSIIGALKAIMATSDGHTFFVRHFTENDTSKREINFGIAHGLPSVISFLLMVNQLGIRKNEVSEILTRLCDFMVKVGVVRDDEIMYPYSDVFFRGHPYQLPIRMGWCYGDVGIAFLLLVAGKQLDKANYTEVGSKIAKQAAGRTDLTDCQVVDGSICHGSAGLSLIFNQLHELTQDKVFENTSGFWQNISLQLCHHVDGIGGYMFWKGDKDNRYTFKREYGFLEGVTGMAMSFLIKQAPGKASEFDWHQLLLLPK